MFEKSVEGPYLGGEVLEKLPVVAESTEKAPKLFDVLWRGHVRERSNLDAILPLTPNMKEKGVLSSPDSDVLLDVDSSVDTLVHDHVEMGKLLVIAEAGQLQV